MPKFTVMEKVSADPAANAPIIYVADENMIVHSVHFSLVTDATAANRTMSLSADDGTDTFFRVYANTSQTASSTVNYSAFEGSVSLTAGGGNLAQTIAFPAMGLKLRQGDRLLATIGNPQAGDGLGPMTLQVERVG